MQIQIKQKQGHDTIHAEDVSKALIFLFNFSHSNFHPDETGAKCQKFNIVGRDEIEI